MACLLSSAKTTGTILLIAATASVMGFCLTYDMLPQRLAASLTSSISSTVVMMLIFTLIYLFLGTIMEGSAIILTTVPIFVTICQAMDIDLVYFRRVRQPAAVHRHRNAACGHRYVRHLQEQRPDHRTVHKKYAPVVRPDGGLLPADRDLPAVPPQPAVLLIGSLLIDRWYYRIDKDRPCHSMVLSAIDGSVDRTSAGPSLLSPQLLRHDHRKEPRKDRINHETYANQANEPGRPSLLPSGWCCLFFTGQIPAVGRMLLPMHIPVLLCGLICGWKYGLAVGAVLPLTRSLLFGIPTLYPRRSQ